jgi:16S rRNA (cytosine967-C5)-methyltransferase
MEEKVAVRVIIKYLKKGNMARCLRDILPSAGLTLQQREEVADVVHTVVRWKKLYSQMIHSRGLQDNAESYVDLALEGAHIDAASYPFEDRYSCSSYVASILQGHEEWAAYLNTTPPTSLCVNYNKSSPDEVITILTQENLPVERSILPTALRSTSASKYSMAVKQRFAHVQDESSQLVSFLTTSQGHSIFDFCAGNGGKSLAIASMTKNGKTLHAFETNASKRVTLKRRCDEYDAAVLVEDQPSGKQYDLVLVDAPCSGLGAARRNPEVKYIDTIDSYPGTQLSILTAAAENVKQGGLLFYAVCTITPEETAQVIQTFLKKNTYTVLPVEHLPYKEYLHQTANGAFTVLPHGDLFYLSLLKNIS